MLAIPPGSTTTQRHDALRPSTNLGSSIRRADRPRDARAPAGYLSRPMSLLDELEQRGLIAEVTHKDELAKLIGSQAITLYAGYDPTASSLHIGNLVPTMLLKR